MEKSMILNRIDELKNQRNLTTNALAEKTDIVSTTFYNWYSEKKNKSPSLQSIESICNAFEITLCEFFSFTAESKLSALQFKLMEEIKTLNESQIETIIYLIKALKGNTK